MQSNADTTMKIEKHYLCQGDLEWKHLFAAAVITIHPDESLLSQWLIVIDERLAAGAHMGKKVLL